MLLLVVCSCYLVEFSVWRTSESTVNVYADVCIGDVVNFVHIPDGVKVMIGYDNLVYGEAVPGFGNDGVVQSDLKKLEMNSEIR